MPLYSPLPPGEGGAKRRVRGEQVAQSALTRRFEERDQPRGERRLVEWCGAIELADVQCHQSGIILVMNERAVTHAQESTVARTIRIPAALRERIATDAERCGRSFEGQVIALLRRHYGEDVDIAPAPAGILALAIASLADIPASQHDLLTRKLEDRER
jgi:hypothetical protein